MSQSNVIFGFLFAALIIYVVAKGKLSTYLGFFLG